MKKLLFLLALIPTLLFGQTPPVYNVLGAGNDAKGRGLIGLGIMSLKGSTSGTVSVNAPAVVVTYTFTLPPNDGTSGQYLQTDGNGVLTWQTVSTGLTVGTTAISSGTSGRILYDNAGVLGEYSSVPIAFGGTNNTSAYTSGSVIFSDGTSLTQDNSKLFWDDGNNYLGIGINSSLGSNLHIKGYGSTSSTFNQINTNSAGTVAFKSRDDAVFMIDNLSTITGSQINMGSSVGFLFNSGVITSAYLASCAVNNSYIDFLNTSTLRNIYYSMHGDNTTMSSVGGGVGAVCRFARANGNSNYDLNNFTAPATGIMMFCSAYTPYRDRLSIVGVNDKFQLFTNSGWTMGIGTPSKSLGDADENTTASVGYVQAELQAVSDRLKATRQVLLALINFMGNFSYDVTADNTTDYINLSGNALLVWQRVRIISGTPPTGLSLNTNYYIRDISGDNFKLATSVGGSAINFTTDGSNLKLQIDYSGMNLLSN